MATVVVMFAETTICLTINESELAFAYKKLFTQELTEQKLLTQLFLFLSFFLQKITGVFPCPELCCSWNCTASPRPPFC